MNVRLWVLVEASSLYNYDNYAYDAWNTIKLASDAITEILFWMKNQVKILEASFIPSNFNMTRLRCCDWPMVFKSSDPQQGSVTRDAVSSFLEHWLNTV